MEFILEWSVRRMILVIDPDNYKNINPIPNSVSSLHSTLFLIGGTSEVWTWEVLCDLSVPSPQRDDNYCDSAEIETK